MGYHTQYELEVDDMQPLKDDDSWFDGFIVARALIFDGFHDACKWYDHEQDMRFLSKHYPTVTFTLSGVGEEVTLSNCDAWIKTFKGGQKIRQQQGEITFKDV